MTTSVVTGGLGFIGSHLTDRLLEKGHTVFVIDNEATGRRANLAGQANNPKLTILNHDIGNALPDSLIAGNVDYFFHLAGLADIVPSIEQPEQYFRANVTGTLNTLEWARRRGVKKFVYTASSSCYGLPDQIPTPETAAIKPEYPYALTKNLGEQMSLHWAKIYKMPVVSLRLFNVFGPRSRTTGAYGAVFGVFLAQKLAGKPMTIVGDGKQTRDFTYVADVVEAFVAAAESNVVGEVFNVGSGHTQSVNRLVELLGGEKVHIPKRPGEPDSTFADIKKITSMLDWKPRVAFEDGVKRMIARIDDWRTAPVWTPESINVATETWFKYLTPAKSAK